MMNPFSEVLPIDSEVGPDGHLYIGGCDATELADRYATPLYVYDVHTMRTMCREFVDQFGSRYPNSRALYASKAYLGPAMARLVAGEGLGMDVVSGGELAVARSVDFPPEDIFFHGNNKSPDEVAEALDYGIGRFVVDSFHELEMVGEMARQRGVVQPVMLRLSPSIDAHTHAKTTTGILDTKFGFPIETGDAAEAIRRALKTSNLDLTGIHIHLGSPIFELEPYSLGIDTVLTFLAPFRAEGLELRDFSPGGGFAVGYVRDQLPPPISAYADFITRAVRDRSRDLGFAEPRLLVEPGRSIVARAGVALYTVGGVKDIPGLRKYVSVDGGMGDNIRPALYDARYEAMLANRVPDDPSGGDLERVRIVGKYCETGDILVKEADLPSPRTGDLVAMPSSGAYGISMAGNYNMNPRPAVVMVEDGESRLVRRRETYDDLLSVEMDPGA
jgi:diaminopimelate decarboxylase